MTAATYRMAYQNPRPAEASNGLVWAGYLTGVLLAPVGFFVGLALVLKNRAGHGVAVMCIAVLVTVSLVYTTTRDSSGGSVQIEVAPTSTPSLADCVANADTGAQMDACLDRP